MVTGGGEACDMGEGDGEACGMGEGDGCDVIVCVVKLGGSEDGEDEVGWFCGGGDGEGELVEVSVCTCAELVSVLVELIPEPT